MRVVGLFRTKTHHTPRHDHISTPHGSVIDSYNRLQDDARTTQADRNLSVQTLVNAYYGACIRECACL